MERERESVKEKTRNKSTPKKCLSTASLHSAPSIQCWKVLARALLNIAKVNFDIQPSLKDI